MYIAGTAITYFFTGYIRTIDYYNEHYHSPNQTHILRPYREFFGIEFPVIGACLDKGRYRR